MTQQNKRPRFLTPWQIHLPLAGVVSILHRLSGIALFLFLPSMLYLLELSLSGVVGYRYAGELLQGWPARVVGLLLLWLFAHHLFAGIRVLLIDMEWGVDKLTARRTAAAVLAAAALLVTMSVAI